MTPQSLPTQRARRMPGIESSQNLKTAHGVMNVMQVRDGYEEDE